MSSEFLTDGLVFLLGNEQSPRNYADNPYPFRQDSTFLYYLGLDVPSLAVVLDLDNGTTRLYGDDFDLDDVIWMGNRPSVSEYAQKTGISDTSDWDALPGDLGTARETGRRIHFLPPYRPSQRVQLEAVLDIPPSEQADHASTSLAQAVVQQRSRKTEPEVDELETALETTARMHEYAMRSACPGATERAIAGSLSGLAEAHGAGFSFPPTCSIHGEVLHNRSYENELQRGDLLLVDAGAESSLHYAGDVTRVAPVGGTFSPRQKALYEAVVDAQTQAIDEIEPNRTFREVHLHAAHVLTDRLIDIGLMKGDPDAAVEVGAHALFFPHGLGHMLGLDTHDMENLGEDVVGYAPDQERSDQFGLHTLRLARPLKPGFAVTVEPGCYFIPSLIEQWSGTNRHSDFINYDVVSDFVGIGGIRIEDDVLVTQDGARVLGPRIPKTAGEVESIVGTSTAA